MMRTSTIEGRAEVATRFPPGSRVEVRTGFDRSWAKGFEVVAVLDGDRYQVRRLSDGMELPTPFPAEEVRRARRENEMWWV
jgi:hypothetical protein